MLLPAVCPVCASVGAAPCRRCLLALEPAPPLEAPPGLDGCLALLAYEGAGRELVVRLKYRSNRAALAGIGRAMASLLPPPPSGGPPVLTWAPTTPARRRQRGFDHAELLARAVGRALGTRPRRLLRRVPGPAQTGRSLAERTGAPSFEVVGSVPSAVVLVDDVVTSGATMAAAARVLRAAGAPRVVGLSAARTPPPAPMSPRVVDRPAQAPTGW